jgi:uncharacterized repeat protein (TIGR01451 family)
VTDGRFGHASRWRITTAATTTLVALGVASGRPAYLLAGVVPLAYVAMVNATGVSEAAVAVERAVDPAEPTPGEAVSVTLTVENAGASVLADCRVVDGVPPNLAVVEGSPRAAVGLQPGESRSFEYAVVARRGSHEFDAPRVRARSLTGADAYTGVADQDGDAELRCELPLEDVPLRDETVEFFGRVQTDTPGSGLEFHSTREYRPGDRLTRINWRRYAETGEMTTVEFRESRSATVVLVVDARPAADVATGPGQPSAVEHALYAAERAVGPLREAGNRVGVTALGPTVGWADPTGTRAAERRVQDVAAAVEADGGAASADGGTLGDGRDPEADPGDGRDPETDPGDGAAAARALCRTLPGEAQVVLLSPLVDDAPVDATRVFGAYGHPVTVLSPDPTGGDTAGQRLAGVRRRARLVECREVGGRVVDWDPAESLSVALGAALRRWVER